MTSWPLFAGSVIPSCCCAAVRIWLPVPPGELRPRGRDLSAEPELRRQLVDDRAQVQCHLATLGGDRPPAAVEDRQQLAVRNGVGLAPCALHRRAGQQLRSHLIGELAQAAGGRAGQPCDLLRQDPLQLPGHVDGGEQLTNQVRADRLIDLRIGDQPTAGVRPVARAQHLAIDPDREDRQQPDDHPDRQQHADEHPVRVLDDRRGRARPGRGAGLLRAGGRRTVRAIGGRGWRRWRLSGHHVSFRSVGRPVGTDTLEYTPRAAASSRTGDAPGPAPAPPIARAPTGRSARP